MDTKVTILRRVLIASIAFALGFATHATFHSEPSCPTEDSCSISYHDGAWTITPNIP